MKMTNTLSRMKQTFNSIHPDLIAAQKQVYEPIGFVIEHFLIEKESQQYGASEFKMNHQTVKFRAAKITPTKMGQFVTLWKREEKGPIQPFDVNDPFDLVIISVRNPKHFGQFVFPKLLLYTQGILSKNGEGGKRAMRVYPPWDRATNQQAIQTQKWQEPYFFPILAEKPLNKSLVQTLFSSENTSQF